MIKSGARDWGRHTYRRLRDAGVDPRKTAAWLRGRGTYRANRSAFFSAIPQSQSGHGFAWGISFPCYGDRTDSAGDTKGHYFHQDLLVAQDIYDRAPRRHVDVGSSIYGFVSHVATFRPIEIVDIRPLSSSVPNITFLQADVMNAAEVGSVHADSVSCLHALEHFGLGRYGDPVRVDGWIDGLNNLCNMTEPGGLLYLSVPITCEPRIEFDAHRVFRPDQIASALPGHMTIERFSFVDDSGDLHTDIDWRDDEVGSGLDLRYGCGIWFIRKNVNGQAGHATRSEGD